MSSNAGIHLSYTLFGESHGQAIGITITGIPANIVLNLALIKEKLQVRLGGAKFNTPRQEQEEFEIVSGFFNGKTTGTPLTILFFNHSTRSGDYATVVAQPRPGHADFVASVKYHQAQDYRGGGHFSGRLTAPLVFFGEIARQCIMMKQPEYQVHHSIISFAGVNEKNYYDLRKAAINEQLSSNISEKENHFSDVSFFKREHSQDMIVQKTKQAIAKLRAQYQSLDYKFPVHSLEKKQQMESAALSARKAKDSLGGVIETVVMMPPLAIGEPFFHSVESILSQLLFSIGSVKGVSFGYGTSFAACYGSDCKDELIDTAHGKVTTLYNFNGGINGGISNGEDIVFQTLLKPIASILQQQKTLNLETNTLEPLKIKGRHDATIINRVIPVIEAVTHIAILDLLLANTSDRFGQQ